MKRYTEDHEWVEIDGNVATIGISKHAADELGDITFVELPAVGDKVARGGVLNAIESVKAASDVYAPIADRLGMNVLKSELEDLGFANLHPWRHRTIAEHVQEVTGNREEVIETIRKAGLLPVLSSQPHGSEAQG